MFKVLLIEDDRAMRESVAEFLAFAGFDVFEAQDGRGGWNLAQAQLPNLIISDMDMPQMNGYEVFQALRKQPGTAAIPFILLTGSTDDSLREECKVLGIQHYLTKPFALNELLTIIQQIQA